MPEDNVHDGESDIEVLIVFLALGGLALAAIGTVALLWQTGVDVYDTLGMYAGHFYVMMVGALLFLLALAGAKFTEEDDD